MTWSYIDEAGFHTVEAGTYTDKAGKYIPSIKHRLFFIIPIYGVKNATIPL